MFINLLRGKIVQHELWRVGDSPFFVVEWKASFSLDPPSLQFAPIWAKLSSVPFDNHRRRFRAHLRSVNSAEVKNFANLTKPLHDTLEIERDNRQID